MVLLCPVCLLDKQGPIALPGCRAYHPAAIEAAKQQQLQQTQQQQSGSAIDKLPKALEYASSCIIPTTWTEFQLVQVLPHNHDTSIFEFGLKPGQRLELPVRQHYNRRRDGRTAANLNSYAVAGETHSLHAFSISYEPKIYI